MTYTKSGCYAESYFPTIDKRALLSTAPSDTHGATSCSFFSSLARRILHFICIGNQPSVLITPVGLSDLFLAKSTRNVRACSASVMLDQLAILDKVYYNNDSLVLKRGGKPNADDGTEGNWMVNTYSVAINDHWAEVIEFD